MLLFFALFKHNVKQKVSNIVSYINVQELLDMRYEAQVLSLVSFSLNNLL